MEIIEKEKIAPFIPLLKGLCVLAAFGSTAVLLFKDLYLYDWADKKDTILYSIPMVFIFFFWIKSKLDEPNFLHLEILRIDALAIFLTAIRMVGLLFHSGHVLFLAYTFVTTQNKFYRIICMPMILMTFYYKFIYWGDFTTPFIGAIIAIGLIYLRWIATNKITTETP